ncbi:MAG: ABC-ATPase domain-containing protein, partial [Kocuria sp.]|nr:ABC-ATPase domain-containing protein [Kocuria sp.]
MNQTTQDLRSSLQRLDGNGYGAYKRIRGTYDFGTFDLAIDHVQSDPYAPPSSVRVILPLDGTSLPERLENEPEERVAAADFIARHLTKTLCGCSYRGINITKPGQEVLERSSVVVRPDSVEVRLSVSLPAAGRRIKGRAAAHLLTDDLPELVQGSALLDGLDLEALERHIELYTDQLALQAAL